jgi:hypothetical protein
MKKEIFLTGIICAGLVGCSSAPGTSGQQGAVVGGATGAAVGATVTHNRALGAIIGGAAGAAGGYVIGNKTGPLDKKGDQSTTTSSTSSTGTADANRDGFVTLDEIVDMRKEGMSDDEMLDRIAATGLTFDLNEEQRRFLSDHGVSQRVIDRLPSLNRTSAPVGNTVIGK